MATSKAIDGTAKKINTIFNPYVKANHVEINAKAVDIKAVGVVNSAYFWTNNTLHKADNKKIYIYKIPHDFADTGQIIVTPNSEGYVLIDLPKTLPKTTKVTLKLQSLGPPIWGSSGFENKLKQQDRIYRIQRTIEITVDIEELGINRIPKNIEGEREK